MLDGELGDQGKSSVSIENMNDRSNKRMIRLFVGGILAIILGTLVSIFTFRFSPWVPCVSFFASILLLFLVLPWWPLKIPLLEIWILRDNTGDAIRFLTSGWHFIRLLESAEFFHDGKALTNNFELPLLRTRDRVILSGKVLIKTAVEPYELKREAVARLVRAGIAGATNRIQQEVTEVVEQSMLSLTRDQALEPETLEYMKTIIAKRLEDLAPMGIKPIKIFFLPKPPPEVLDAITEHWVVWYEKQGQIKVPLDIVREILGRELTPQQIEKFLLIEKLTDVRQIPMIGPMLTYGSNILASTSLPSVSSEQIIEIAPPLADKHPQLGPATTSGEIMPSKLSISAKQNIVDIRRSESRLIPVKILTVEDDTHYQKVIVRELATKGGYDVDGRSTYEDALNALQQNLYHLLMLDISLGGLDSLDEQGFEILSALKRLGQLDAFQVIMLSAREQKIRDSFKEFHVYDFIIKGGDFSKEKLHEAVSKAIIASGINYQLKIVFRDLSRLHETLFDLGSSSKMPQIPNVKSRIVEEFDLLMRKLFPTEQEIEIRCWPQEKRNSTLLAVQPLANGHNETLLVKWGLAWDVAVEIENYKSQVEGTITGSFYPFRVAQTPWLRGIAYKVPGRFDRLIDFELWYESHSPEAITPILDKLFEGFRPWYNKPSARISIPLFQELTENMFLNEARIKITLEKLDPLYGDQASIRFPNIKDRDFLNPINDPRIKSVEIESRKCYNYGRLLAKNILFDEHDGVHVLDFSRVGWGFYLQDFIQLESDIRINLAPGRDLGRILALDEMLSRTEYFDTLSGELIKESATHDAQSAKMVQVVCHLRALCRHMMNFQDPQEYYLGLLFTMLALTTDNNLSKSKRIHALLVASLLFQHNLVD